MSESNKVPSERQVLGKITLREDDQYTAVSMPKHWFKLVAGGLILLTALGVGLTAWGAAQQAETLRLREQVTLQQEQLKLLNEKANTLDAQIKHMELLDQEVRQMISGSEKGKIPQGGGTNADIVQKPAAPAETTVNTTQLMAKYGGLQGRLQKELISLTMLKVVLMTGAASDIQNLHLALGKGNVDSPIPSIWPTRGVISSPFGGRQDPVNGGSAVHEGIDIANDYGTPIVATATGVVKYANYSGGYGLMVEIDHGNGFTTRYGHNSTLLVTEGMTVHQGDTIALMGSTGKSTGSHSHYEVRSYGEAVDPALFLPSN